MIVLLVRENCRQFVWGEVVCDGSRIDSPGDVYSMTGEVTTRVRERERKKERTRERGSGSRSESTHVDR